MPGRTAKALTTYRFAFLLRAGVNLHYSGP